MSDPCGRPSSGTTAPGGGGASSAPSAPSAADGHMRFLCDLCEKLIAQMSVLTDRYEEEKQTSAALREELEGQRALAREWRRRAQQLEDQVTADADVLQRATAALADRDAELAARLRAQEEEHTALLYAVERRHQRELAELQAPRVLDKRNGRDPRASGRPPHTPGQSSRPQHRGMSCDHVRSSRSPARPTFYPIRPPTDGPLLPPSGSPGWPHDPSGLPPPPPPTRPHRRQPGR
eukprot:TRINITY_DN10038_c0_g1_i1.p1 TRINITY_DN10038_c0_g1~~TRINITY_DN10038_c0_g1_i1.p1  ORF type:complete len:235 (+),score=52.02 TRINITY_DN10038_c0_g1_i1:102-806(+)